MVPGREHSEPSTGGLARALMKLAPMDPNTAIRRLILTKWENIAQYNTKRLPIYHSFALEPGSFVGIKGSFVTEFVKLCQSLGERRKAIPSWELCTLVIELRPKDLRVVTRN